MNKNETSKRRAKTWRRLWLVVVLLLTFSGIAFALEARALACDGLCSSSACNIGSGGCCTSRSECAQGCSIDRSAICIIETGLCCGTTMVGCVCGTCADCHFCPPCGI